MLINNLTSLNTAMLQTHLTRVEAAILKHVNENRPEDGPWLSNLRLQRSRLVNELTRRGNGDVKLAA